MNAYFKSILVVSVALSGCAGEGGGTGRRPLTDMETGALIGAVGGAVVGAVAYHQNRTKGAVIGAVGGGLAGGAVGAYMDSQKRDLEKNLTREIQSGEARVDKLPNDVVRITMTSQTAFDTDSVNIKPGFHSTLDKLADVVVRYGKTSLTIVGHTDNVGSDQYNQKLSERRALSVAQYFESRQVSSLRLATLGKGEGAPVASNNSESGRQANRRVEIYVEPVVQG
ncbi:MAG TPA: OmpA family protein [Burkholderiales bacterium]|nr:OmpA family protein [Burkholderiales bacterium]